MRLRGVDLEGGLHVGRRLGEFVRFGGRFLFPRCLPLREIGHRFGDALFGVGEFGASHADRLLLIFRRHDTAGSGYCRRGRRLPD